MTRAIPLLARWLLVTTYLVTALCGQEQAPRKEISSDQPGVTGTTGATGTTGGTAANASATCPFADAKVDPDHQINFGKIPAVLQPGTPIEIKISPALQGTAVTAICFDSLPLPPPKTDSDFSITIPQNSAAPQQPWPAGDHVITVQTGRNLVVRQSLRSVPKLDSVRALPMRPGDNAFRVVFTGDGFDTQRVTGNSIRMAIGGGVTVDQNVCWTDADCSAKNSKVRGEIKTPQEIIVSNLDPADERGHEFQVCVSGRCTDSVADKSTEYLWLAPAISLVITLLLAGMIVCLAWRLKPLIIDGEPYLLSILFLDKETNTYSLSKLQFYIWSLAATFGYIALTISRNFYQHFTGLPPVPSGLPGIVAIAAGTAVGAQVVTNINGPKGAGQQKPSIADLVTTGDVVAAERVQYLVWTVIGAFSFFAIVWVADPRAMTDLPEVPWSLLSISGLSAFGYLGGKLARNPGPVLIEMIAKQGPDPAPVKSQPPAPATSNAAIADARANVADARAAIAQVGSEPATVKAVVDAATKACDAAEKAIGAAGSSQLAQAKTSAADASASAAAAATAAQPLKGGTTDGDNAAKAVAAAQKAAQAASAIAAASPSAVSTFGLLEIRGRTLSRDATFKISRQAEHATDDLDISFDLLQPDPDDPKQVKKPRVVEVDSDASDETMAKRLLLVINIADPHYAALFDEKSVHTLTITNPDSQKAMLKYRVPESQKSS